MNDRYLLLMRHAKSSWANDSLSDFDRPLNERGRKSLPLMQNWLQERAINPDCILCSSAVRAQETANLIRTSWPLPYSKIDLQELYLASPNTILETIRQHTPSKSRTLLVIGHNPGFEVLASMLSGKAIVMPTAAIAVFRVRSQDNWCIDLSESPTQLEHFIVPREIQPSLDGD